MSKYYVNVPTLTCLLHLFNTQKVRKQTNRPADIGMHGQDYRRPVQAGQGGWAPRPTTGGGGLLYQHLRRLRKAEFGTRVAINWVVTTYRTGWQLRPSSSIIIEYVVESANSLNREQSAPILVLPVYHNSYDYSSCPKCIINMRDSGEDRGISRVYVTAIRAEYSNEHHPLVTQHSLYS